MKSHEGIPRVRRVREEQKCDFCGKIFDDTETLTDHKLYVHENIKSHQCSTCYMAFGYLESLRKHERHEHGKIIEKRKWSSLKKISNAEKYSCDFCDHTCRIKDNMKRHIESGEIIFLFFLYITRHGTVATVSLRQ